MGKAIEQAPAFRPFDPRKEVRVYWRHLPHWRQDGACYFVTARLNDSIPPPVLAGWREERKTWLAAHDIDPDAFSREAYLRVPAARRRAFERRHHRLIQDCLDDAHGSCRLRDADGARIVLEGLRFFHGSRCWTGDGVVMPNHLHALVIPFDGVELESLMQSVKAHTAREVNKRCGRHGQLWQRDSYDHIVRDRAQLAAFRRYMAKNAKQAGLAPGGYGYHRADWLDAYAAL